MPAFGLGDPNGRHPVELIGSDQAGEVGLTRVRVLGPVGLPDPVGGRGAQLFAEPGEKNVLGQARPRGRVGSLLCRREHQLLGGGTDQCGNVAVSTLPERGAGLLPEQPIVVVQHERPPHLIGGLRRGQASGADNALSGQQVGHRKGGEPREVGRAES